MEKIEQSSILLNHKSGIDINTFDNLLSNCSHLQNSSESDFQYGDHNLDSSIIDKKSLNLNIPISPFEKIQTNKNVINNSISYIEKQNIQVQKGINDLNLQKVASFVLSQLPKKNVKKNSGMKIEPKLLNPFSSYANQCNKPINYNQIDLKKIEQKQDTQENSSCHRKFTEEEDEMLKRIVFTFGPKNWRLIASLMPERTARQCRDRYSNYLAPGFIHTEWTKEEDKLLAEKFTLIGPKWTQMRQYFPYRTANDIKNRYNYTISRKLDLLKSGKDILNDASQNHKMKNNHINHNLSPEAENHKNETIKFQNDIYSNEDIIEINQDPFFFINDDLHTNDFDFTFINE